MDTAIEDSLTPVVEEMDPAGEKYSRAYMITLALGATAVGLSDLALVLLCAPPEFPRLKAVLTAVSGVITLAGTAALALARVW